ncbi:MAG: phytoene desaturase family protein [Endomicrobia bacterium]|nr:phytoene desaturase family protein [Endomicrobiia bacterium]
MKKKVAIIGAGPGGLTAGVILQDRGFDVTIFEKLPIVGGRNSCLEFDGFRFDLGPTFLMMPHILIDVFNNVGENINSYLKLIKLDPMYTLYFSSSGRKISMTSDHEEMSKRIKEIFNGEEGFYEYLDNEEKRLNYLIPCLEKPYCKFYDMLSKPFLKAIPHLDIGKSVWEVLGKYFKDEELKLCFTFQSKYLGMSAWECPGAFAMIAYVEHKYGIWHIEGGLNRISQALAKVLIKKGGKIFYNSEVEKIVNIGKKIKGVKLKNGEFFQADYVIVNADFSYAATNLMDKQFVKKYSLEKLKKKKYSCSTFMIYLGLKKLYKHLSHHNVFFAKNYKENVDDIFKNFKLQNQISFYIQNASITDSTLAPEGKSTLYILVPVANLKADIDWEKEKRIFRERIIKEVKEKANLSDLEENIEVEHIITPLDWQNKYNVFLGATFNLAHNLSQMLYFRPRNKFECFDNLYLVGGGTHPGSGLPTIFKSGEISANLIIKHN